MDGTFQCGLSSQLKPSPARVSAQDVCPGETDASLQLTRSGCSSLGPLKIEFKTLETSSGCQKDHFHLFEVVASAPQFGTLVTVSCIPWFCGCVAQPIFSRRLSLLIASRESEAL